VIGSGLVLSSVPEQRTDISSVSEPEVGELLVVIPHIQFDGMGVEGGASILSYPE